MGVSGLFIATIFGHAMRVIRLFWAEKDSFFSKENHGFTVIKIKYLAWRYKKFPIINSWSSLLGKASTQIPVILFSSFFSTNVAGYYSLSHRILNLPMGLIGQSVGQVFLERAAKSRNNIQELQRLSLGIYKKLLLIGSIIMSFVTFYGDIIFPFVFGKEWVIAGKYAQWISLWLIFVFAASPLSHLYSILERQGEGFLTNIVMFLSRIIVILIASLIGISDIKVIAAFSLLGAILWIGMCFRILLLVKIPFQSICKTSLYILGPIYGLQFVIALSLRKLLWQF
jgi:O-antigen/teichoic acid export membrane protein